MVWFRDHLAFTLLLAAMACTSGCQTNQAMSVSCGENHGCTADQDPLIIFIGADRDVGKWGKLPEVAERFRCCGYNAVYLDPWKQLHDVELLTSWIRHAAGCQGRRVMLVGWSQGTIVGLKALKILAKEGIRVDTFVDLDCFNVGMFMGKHPHPCNADRVVVIHSRLNRPANYCCPVVHHLDSCWHLGSPTNPHTTRVLFSEACRLRQSVCNEIPAVPTVPLSNLSGSSKSTGVE